MLDKAFDFVFDNMKWLALWFFFWGLLLSLFESAPDNVMQQQVTAIWSLKPWFSYLVGAIFAVGATVRDAILKSQTEPDSETQSRTTRRATVIRLSRDPDYTSTLRFDVGIARRESSRVRQNRETAQGFVPWVP